MTEELGHTSLEILHVGNDPFAAGGGISAVIAGHMARMQGRESVLQEDCAVSFDGRGSLLHELRLVIRAAQRVITSKDGELVHVHLSQRGSFLREGSLLVLAKAIGRKTIVTLHGSVLGSSPSHARLALRVLVKWADRVHGFYPEIVEKYGIPDSKWIQIPNDVAVPTSVRPIQQRSRTVLFVGEIGSRKGVDRLLNVWSSVRRPGWELVMVGPIGHDGEALLERAHRCRAVSVVEATTREHVQSMMQDARVLVLFSRAEAFPMAICEGLANGCAVVGTPVGGAGALLTSSGQSTVRNEREARVALSRIMNDEVTQEVMSESGHSYAIAVLSERVVTDAWISAYSELQND